MSRLGFPLALLCQIKPSLMRLLQLPPEVTAYSIRQTLISVFQESTHLSFYGTTGYRELTIRRNWQSIVNYPLHTKRKLTHISLASFLWDIGKQCRLRSDAALRGV